MRPMKRAVITRRAFGYWVELEEQRDDDPGSTRGIQPKVTRLDGRWTLTRRGARRLGRRLVREHPVVEVINPPDPNESYGYICRRGSQPG